MKSTSAAAKTGIVLGDIQLELNVLIFTLLINMGFLRLTEISVFISTTSRTVRSVGTHPGGLWPVILVGCAVVAYALYVGSIFLGVLQTFLKRDPKRAMCISLVGFFVVYACIFLNSVSNA